MKIKELLSLFCLSSEVKAVYLMRATEQPAIQNENIRYEDRFEPQVKTYNQTLTSLQDLSVIADGEIESAWVNGKMLIIREKGR